MTQTAHTPGPYEVRQVMKRSNFDKQATYHITARRKDYDGREYIATIATVGGLPTDSGAESKANASLMAEAPNMLEALKPFAVFAEAFKHLHGTTPKTGDFYVMSFVKDGEQVDCRITVEDFKSAAAVFSKATGAA